MTRWRSAVDAELGGDSGVISVLVLDELAYRSVLGWMRDEGDRNPLATFRQGAARAMRRMRRRLDHLWRAVDELQLEIVVADKSVAAQAIVLMREPGLAPRDAFHAAHALDSRCPVIVSADSDYDAVDGLLRIGPTQ